MPETTETTIEQEVAENENSVEATVTAKERLIGGVIAAGVLVLLTVILVTVSLLWHPASNSELSEPTTEPTSEPTVATEPPETEPNIPANPYGPSDFHMTGYYMTCLAGESVLGIDVSSYQKEVNWEVVRNAGIEFVIIRLGYRGTELGLLNEDNLAQSHYAGAKAAGLQVGAYFFSQAVSEEEAREEAEYAMSLIADWELDMPLVFDWEYMGKDARTADVDGDLLTDCVLAFCETAESAGIEPMIYFNPNMVGAMLQLERLTDYRFWLAYYNSEMTFPYKVDMWQYTSQGTIPGISGNVDLDIYLPYE